MFAHSGVSCAIWMWVGAGSQIPPRRAGSSLTLSNPGTSLPLCPGSLLSAVQEAPTDNTPVGALEEHIRCSDFLFLLFLSKEETLLPFFLVCFRFFGLGFVGLFGFSLFCFGLVFVYLVSPPPSPPHRLVSVTWISPEFVCSGSFFIAKSFRNLTEVRKLWGRKGLSGWGGIANHRKFQHI